jgi:hypothetical protein
MKCSPEGAFRKDRWTEDHIVTLQGLCSVRLFTNRKTYLAVIDLSKAFDRACFIYYGNVEYNVSVGSCLDHFIIMSPTKFCLVISKAFFFDQDCGLKQECVIYPTLFSVLKNDLVDMLQNRNVCIELAPRDINCLLFADDIVLLEKSEAVL